MQKTVLLSMSIYNNHMLSKGATMEYIKSWGLSLLTALGFISPTTEIDISKPITIGTTEITIMQGDITQQYIDAIVNAANEHLSHGGGVALAISKAAGPEFQKYSDAMPIISNGEKCPTGSAVITPAFKLEKNGIKKVIHATGPRGDNPNKKQLLYDTYYNSLQVAHDNGLKSIAFPAISTAIFGYDINEATPVAFAATRDFIKAHPKAFVEVRFVLFSDKDLVVYGQYAGELLK